MTETKKRPVILDCDPGVDDAVALFMTAAHGSFDLLGVTPVNGNKPLAVCERNTLQLMELIHRENIPVLRGAPKGIFVENRTSGDVHGASGLGSAVFPDPIKTIEDEYAWDFIHRQALAHKGELEILAIGPLTNIGTALLKYPDLPQYIKQIVIMGGGITMGNWTGAAEFNIWADPDAARLVFRSGIHIVMASLEICFEARIMADEVAALKTNGGPASSAAGLFIGEREAGSGGKGAILCDAVAAAYMIDPSVITESFEANVDVETGGSYAEGRTVAKRIYREFVNDTANTTVLWHIDRPRFAQMIIDLCKQLDDSNT